MLVRLVYASRAAGTVDEETLLDILAASRRNNPDAGVTGLLCVCHDEYYLQVLEGGRNEVNALYAKILKDPRHSDITIISYSEIRARQYANWRMARADLDKLNRGVVLKYAEHDQINPYCLPSRSILALLRELTTSAAIVAGT